MVRTVVVLAVLRLGVTGVGPVPAAAVASGVITAASVRWWARAVEPRLFATRECPARSLPAVGTTDAERHLAFAEALAAVALSYVDHCRVEAQTFGTPTGE
jgi:hypothetical protein